MVTAADQTPNGTYDDGMRAAFLIAAAHVRRWPNMSHEILAADLEDTSTISADPKQCGHPYWTPAVGGKVACRTCGADMTDVDPMGR